MLAALNDIEWQLCMRMMSHRDGLAFALCSRATLRAASAPFPWSACEPLLYDSAVHSAPPSSLLLRFAPIHLRWRPLIPFTDRCSEADVDALLSSLIHVRHLDASAFTSVTVALWARVLRSPWAQQLRALTLSKGPSRWLKPVSSSVWPLLGLNLRSLSLGALQVTELKVPLSPHAFPNLTSLSFDALCPGSLQLFTRCPIRHATLIRPPDSDLNAFLRSRSVSGLRTLRLESTSLTEDPLTSAICDLRSLRTLHLVRVALVNDVMRDLQMRSALERVIIEPGRRVSHPAFSPTLPWLPALCGQLAIEDSPLPLFTFRIHAQHDGKVSQRCARYLASIDAAVRHHITIEPVPSPGFSKRPGRDCDEPMLQQSQRPSQTLNPHAADSDQRRWVGPLPTDLMRLVFAHLPAVDRFVLARCSPWTVRIADSPISWMHAMLPVEVTRAADKLCEDPVHAPRPSHPLRFSRHCPLALHWTAGMDRTLAYGGRVISLLQREPNLLVHRLDCTDLRSRQVTQSIVDLLIPIDARWMRQYERLIARPALRRVRSVTICESMDASVMRQLSSLACLESLSVALPRSLLRDEPSSDWVAIFASGFRSLRHLRVKAIISVSKLLPLFGHLPRLERLELDCPWNDTDASTRAILTLLGDNSRLSVSLRLPDRETAESNGSLRQLVAHPRFTVEAKLKGAARRNL